MFNYNFSGGFFSSPLFYLLALADLALRGVSLYKSARKDQRLWFVALLIINSMGVFPLIYLLINKDITYPATPKSATKKTVSKGKK